MKMEDAGWRRILANHAADYGRTAMNWSKERRSSAANMPPFYTKFQAGGCVQAKDMPIRILHVIDSLGNGGLENGVVNLIRHMDRLRVPALRLRRESAWGESGFASAHAGAGVVPIGNEEKRFQISDLIKRAIARSNPTLSTLGIGAQSKRSRGTTGRLRRHGS